MTEEKPAGAAADNRADTPLQTENQPAEPVDGDAAIVDSAEQTVQAIDHNAALAGDGDGKWRAEPASNFVRDGRGRFAVGPGGEPARRGGRPRKSARQNEPLAGDTVTDKAPDAVDPGPAAAASDADTLGADAGDVLTDLADNAARAINPKLAMHAGEKKSIANAATQVAHGRRLWPSVALLLFGLAWLLRLGIENKPAKASHADGADTRDHHRPDDDRQNVTGQAPGQGGDWVG